jgi:putative membrane protein insertion efficiency factor
MFERIFRCFKKSKNLKTLIFNFLEFLFKKIFLILIWIYQVTLSPYFGQNCRFYPTCSHYAQEALRTHSLLKALFLITRRLLHCRPFGKSGYDPVENDLKNSVEGSVNPIPDKNS